MYSVFPLICARATVPKAMLMRGTGWGESVQIAAIAWLLRGHDRTLLIDTGLGGRWNDPAYAATRASLGMWQLQAGGTIEQLAAMGLAPDDIDTVILTHLHSDHIASLPAFGSAQIVLSGTGWARARSENHPWVDTYSREVFAWMEAQGDRLNLMSDDMEAPDGIGFHWMGGHSCCSQAILVDTVVGRTAFAGDLVPLAANWETGIPTGHYQNIREVADAYDFLSDFDAVVPGHDPDQPDWMEVAQ